ncbi:MAG TPA: hypothetical protein VFT74_12600, partial [Isosphaeraceae bacterium]|nr:hypothetical protein [Isosphaeraceae bacterium]
PLVEQTEGFHLLGSPQGDASTLRVTRAVLDRLEAGAALDEVLVLFPRWSDLADRTLETLSEAGVPAWSSRQRPLSSDPGISALRLVLDVAAGEWESTDLAALLRMGSIRLEGFERTDLASAASAIRGLRVFRGYEAIRTRLKRETVLEPDEKDPRKQVKAARAASALRVLEALGRIYSGLEAPASWEDRLDHLEDLQAEFSLFGRALDQLRASLQELGDTRNWLGQADPAWSWRAFSREVLALARELCVEPTTEPSRCVRLAPIAEAVGASARHVILAGLEEGTFPDMESLPTESHDPPPDEGEPSSSECAYAREMRRFLSVLDCANETLTLVYPTTDEKGVSLLPAGFLETLRSRLSDEARCRCEDILRRLDPIVPERLALSGSEQRVRAVGLVCLESAELGLPALRTLAALPTHREALLGTARALRVAAERRRRKRFGPFDGDLRGSAAQPGIAREFGPNRPAPFSASQLET